MMSQGVPYSEHSSFFELTCFALSVPGPDLKMIATVNVGNEKRCVFRYDLRCLSLGLTPLTVVRR